MVLRQDRVSSNWSLEVLEVIHNHGPSTAAIAHPARRIPALSPATRVSISTLSRAGISPSQILTILRDTEPEISLIPKDIANLTQKARLEELNGRTPIQWLLEARPFTL